MPKHPIRNHGKTIISSFSSIKNGRLLLPRSTIERDFCYVLELLVWILRYVAQAVPIRAPYEDGSSHSYTPDLEAEGEGVRVIVECKRATEIDDDDTQQQIEIGRAWSRENDYMFWLVTDEALRAGHYLRNVKLVYKYARLTVHQTLVLRAQDIVAGRQGGVTLGELRESLRGSFAGPAEWTVLYTMIFSHHLETDLTLHLGLDSYLTLPTQPKKELPYGAVALC